MKITYDPKCDALYVKLAEGKFVRNQVAAMAPDGVVPYIILDIGEGDVVLGVEILGLQPPEKSTVELKVFAPVTQAQPASSSWNRGGNRWGKGQG